MNLENKIEAILLFKNEPMSLATLSKILGASREDLQSAVSNLQKHYEERGVTIVFDGESLCFGTNPSLSELIETIQKEELNRDLGRAGLETLAIVLYKGPVSRREIDHIRGVNSGFILRNLLVRGLIERTEGVERSYSYKPTLELLRFLGVKRVEDLPEYGVALRKVAEFLKESDKENNADE